MRLFAAGDFHMKSGMKFLIESFYRSIADNTPGPISYREILLTARIMDSIFAQLYGSDPKFEAHAPDRQPLQLVSGRPGPLKTSSAKS
jgi:hypothetical protein